jgi:hypothetical protein
MLDGRYWLDNVTEVTVLGNSILSVRDTDGEIVRLGVIDEDVESTRLKLRKDYKQDIECRRKTFEELIIDEYSQKVIIQSFGIRFHDARLRIPVGNYRPGCIIEIIYFNFAKSVVEFVHENIISIFSLKVVIDETL